MIKDVQKVAIAGAGAMGSAIAQICATAGYQTLLFDVDAGQLERAASAIEQNLNTGIEKGKLNPQDKKQAQENLSLTEKIDDLKADVVIEAIVEKLQPKIDIFSRLATINSKDCIFATNTSSIPITRISASVPHPERVVGMHFFNPAHIMKLVEVISGELTAPEVAQAVKQLAENLGKQPVMVKDSPGFIVNRVARHFYVESLKILEEQVVGFKDIDDLMVASGFRMGPFRLMDLVGMDINFSVTSSLFESFHYDAKFRPSRIQQQKVEAGYLGKKSGKGFYDYGM